MVHLSKSKYVVLNTTFILILVSMSVLFFLHTYTNSSKRQICDYNNIINLINIEKTPDEIARSSENIIIHNLEQSVINKEKAITH